MIVYPLFLGFWEILLIILVIVLFLGGRKIPELMKGVGKGVRNFRESSSDVDDQENQAEK